jgi:hypothetical protein
MDPISVKEENQTQNYISSCFNLSLSGLVFLQLTILLSDQTLFNALLNHCSENSYIWYVHMDTIRIRGHSSDK